MLTPVPSLLIGWELTLCNEKQLVYKECAVQTS